MVPAGDYAIVGGDLNTGSRTESCVTTLAAIVDPTAPAPVDGSGNDNTNGPRSKPHDWVMASAAMMAHEVPTVVGSTSFAHGLVVDTRVYDPIAEISPALAGDSGSSGMQHMGVVRDFYLP